MIKNVYSKIANIKIFYCKYCIKIFKIKLVPPTIKIFANFFKVKLADKKYPFLLRRKPLDEWFLFLSWLILKPKEGAVCVCVCVKMCLRVHTSDVVSSTTKKLTKLVSSEPFDSHQCLRSLRLLTRFKNRNNASLASLVGTIRFQYF